MAGNAANNTNTYVQPAPSSAVTYTNVLYAHGHTGRPNLLVILTFRLSACLAGQLACSDYPRRVATLRRLAAAPLPCEDGTHSAPLAHPARSAWRHFLLTSVIDPWYQCHCPRGRVAGATSRRAGCAGHL